MKPFTPLIALAYVASTVSVGAKVNYNCHAHCYADVMACYSEYSEDGDIFGSNPKGAPTDSIAGQTVEEPPRIVFRGLRDLALENCNTLCLLCLMKCYLGS
jgi:hypothetical protein